MERYRFTFADGSTAEESLRFGQRGDRGRRRQPTAAAVGDCMSSATTTSGRCCPRNCLPAGTAAQWCPKIGMPSPALVGESTVRSDVEAVKGLQDRRRFVTGVSEDMKEYSHGCRSTSMWWCGRNPRNVKRGGVRSSQGAARVPLTSTMTPNRSIEDASSRILHAA